MKIGLNKNKILTENAVLSYKNMKLKDRLGRDWVVPESLDDVYYVTITDSYKDNDVFLSYYRGGVVKNFLTSRCCYDTFLRNAINRIGEKACRHTSTFIDSLISASFIWRCTPEGHAFWSEISNDFISHIRYENKKRKE